MSKAPIRGTMRRCSDRSHSRRALRTRRSQRHERPRARLGRHAARDERRPDLRSAHAPDDTAARRRRSRSASACSVSGERFLEAFLTGFEVECKIAEAIHPGSLQEGLPHVGHGRDIRCRRRGREATRPERRASRAHARDRRELGVRHPRELRQHDEAAARRARGAERCRRGRARRARLHGRKRCARSAVGILPNVQPRRRLRPRADRRRARQPARDRVARRLDQAVSVRRARPSDDGRDAPARRSGTT